MMIPTGKNRELDRAIKNEAHITARMRYENLSSARNNRTHGGIAPPWESQGAAANVLDWTAAVEQELRNLSCVASRDAAVRRLASFGLDRAELIKWSDDPAKLLHLSLATVRP